MTSWFPPPARPRPVENGIKARSKRGRISQTWWSGRFIEVLEAIGLGNRLQRGRNYARRGQVMDMQVTAGAVTALVQGSRVRPYRVRIGLTAFDKTQWGRLEEALAGSAWYAAKLLAGEMPTDIEDVFADVGLSLFPASARELSMDCSCPDSSVPCKHLAAVCYLLAESFDTDPFAILGWRGRDREDLLDNLRALRGAAGPAADAPPGAEPVVPLADCQESYFAPAAALPASHAPETRSDSLLDQLPEIDVRLRGHELVELLRPAYLSATDAGGDSAVAGE